MLTYAFFVDWLTGFRRCVLSAGTSSDSDCASAAFDSLRSLCRLWLGALLVDACETCDVFLASYTRLDGPLPRRRVCPSGSDRVLIRL